VLLKLWEEVHEKMMPSKLLPVDQLDKTAKTGLLSKFAENEKKRTALQSS
jgi:hypothetical protein